MPVSADKYPDERIIHFTFSEPLDVMVDLPEAHRLTAEALGDGDEPIYRIDDVRTIGVSFGKLVHVLLQATRRMPGSLRDNRVKATLIGYGRMSQLASDSVGQRQYGGVLLPLFESLEDALAHIREQMPAVRDGAATA